ncbi:MAG: sorbosone dehydrogenase family protein [Maribacter sp.]|mgnify:FL=1|tara:strand:- start:560 stop:1831 length:1272 start_codon:yes stop_codon:yes gene_type:complete
MRTLAVFFSLIISAYGLGQDKAIDSLPEPFATKSVSNFSNVLGWENGRTPKAPEGFTVTKYADGFENPRWLYELPNGDILVAQSNSNYGVFKQIGAWLIGAGKSKNLSNSADLITLLRDTDKDGMPDVRETFLHVGLNQPFGMLLIGDSFYVANTDALMRYPYKEGQMSITAKGEKIATLPAGKANQHWTRNIITNEDESKIYIAVGSGSNIAEKGIEKELLKANILRCNTDGSELEIFASGLRNPVGMDWEPETKVLWTVVNERDGLGNFLVPDYLTSVQEDGFYGWPYTYFGHEDPRVKIEQPTRRGEALIPDYALKSHTASLGLVFYDGNSFPEKYHGGAFVVQHGSWNKEKLSGYRVIYIPFENGKPSGPEEDFLTGFIVDPQEDEVYGRPVGAIVTQDGSLLVTDDKTHTIWRISAND